MTVENLTSENNTASLTRNAPPVEIALDLLGIHTAHLVRPLDLQYVAELAETDTTEWEPIEVRPWPAEWERPASQVVYHVVSGNHRTSAARKIGLKTIRARIIEAADDKSYFYAAIRTNARHGRNFTEDDRKILAAKLKALGESSTAIAKLFGVNKSTVNNWLSGRDTNAGKKEQREKQSEAMRLLAEVDAGRVDEDWASLPDASVDERQLVQTRREIVDFLRVPAVLDKVHVIKLLRSLELEDKEPLLIDMRVAQRWLQNVTALLEGERASIE